MSRHRSRPQPRRAQPPRTPPPPQPLAPDALARAAYPAVRVPDDLRTDLEALLTESERAKLAAIRHGGTQADADLSRVREMLVGNPDLVAWLNAAERQMTLRAQAIEQAKAGTGTDTWAYAGSGGATPLVPTPFGYAPAGMPFTQRAADGRYGAAGTHSIDEASYDVWSSPVGTVVPPGGGRYDPKSGKTTRERGADAVPSPRMLRQLAKDNEWVRAAITRRRTQVAREPLGVVPRDPLKPWNKSLAKQIQRIIDQPNEAHQNRAELLSMVVEDILVLDRGVLSKNMTLDRRATALYAEDGAKLRIYPGWSGNPNEPRYLWVEPETNTKTPLRNDQCVVFINNPATHRLGLSPIEVLADVISYDTAAKRSAAHLVAMKPPPLIVQLPGAQQNQITAMRDFYDLQVAGRKETFWIGGEAAMNVAKLTPNFTEMQWMEWQEFLCRKIAVTFNMPPSEFGAPQHATQGDATTNRGAYDSEEGLIALLTLIEEYLNSEFLADFAPQLDEWRYDLAALNLKIVFPRITEYNRQRHADKAADLAAKGLVQLPSFTLNQILEMRGEEPVAGGNTFYSNSSMGPVPWLSYDGNVVSHNPLVGMLLGDDGTADNTNPGGKGKGATNPALGLAQATGVRATQAAAKPGKPTGGDKANGSGASNQKKPAGSPKPKAGAGKGKSSKKALDDLTDETVWPPVGRKWDAYMSALMADDDEENPADE